MEAELKNALISLSYNNIILYPTDTVWGLGCDATNEKAVEKIFAIKRRSESKSLVILVDSLIMLQNYVDNISDTIISFLKTSDKPTTVIYEHPKKLAKNVIAHNNTVAIRIVKDEFCKKLICTFGKPIVSTSANISDKPTPKSFKEIETSILDAVDYIVNLRQNDKTQNPSMIVKLTEKDKIEVIRE